MRSFVKVVAVAGLVMLAACGKSATDAATNTEQAYDNAADQLDTMADNTSNDTASDMLENQADATRAAGDNAHDAIENGAAPANGM